MDILSDVYYNRFHLVKPLLPQYFGTNDYHQLCTSIIHYAAMQRHLHILDYIYVLLPYNYQRSYGFSIFHSAEWLFTHGWKYDLIDTKRGRQLVKVQGGLACDHKLCYESDWFDMVERQWAWVLFKIFDKYNIPIGCVGREIVLFLKG